MYQMSEVRKNANEVHICEFCKLIDDCNTKPDVPWNYVLKYCARYDEISLDDFTGEHSR